MQAKTTPQTARRHREAGCDLHRHRSYRALAKCVWPRAYWIDGEGPWASVARCGVTTIQLHSTAARAEAAKDLIDSTGCGGHCCRLHDIVHLCREDGL
jgi:hypothetical protein